MTLLICWLLFPLLLAAICLGCGLLVERAGGTRLPGVLLVPVGLALLIVATQIATATDATAELATPLVVVLALAGFALGARSGRRVDPWAVAAAVGVFAVFAAPIVASGEATFAGYIKLDDTSTWFALTDRVMEHGRNLDGLATSTYEAALHFNLAAGYPVGAFFPLGVGSALIGQDVAWVFQPYLAFLAAVLSLTLYQLASGLVSSRALRALTAFVAGQAALLVGYSLWGGVKEVAAAPLIALIAVLALDMLRGVERPRSIFPLAVALTAAISLMSPAGALIWTAPILLPVMIATLGRQSGATRSWLALLAWTAALTLPWLPSAGFLPPTSSPLTSQEAQGNLFGPLNPLQAFGIWPAGDFRVDPDALTITYLLIGVVMVAGAFALYLAWRRGAWGPLLYAVGSLAAAGGIVVIGSPWVDAKALAIVSPVPLFAALAGAGAFFERTRRVAVLLVPLAIAVGVLWSNTLAYTEVSLAPRDRLADLERIGEIIGDEGPTLMAEYEPYGVRHFLRDADPEGVSELRRRKVPLRGGGVVHKGDSADIDELALSAAREGVFSFRTLVLRQSPAASRPPSPYRLVYSGAFYDVWQRPPDMSSTVIEHLSLGSPVDPASRPPCADVLRLARSAGPDGELAAVSRRPPIVVSLPAGEEPVAARLSDGISMSVRVPDSHRYAVWLGGASRHELEIRIDGDLVGSVGHELSYPGFYMRAGEIRLTAGTHDVEIAETDDDLYPGTHGPPPAIGPLALSLPGERRRLRRVAPADARSLCGHAFDWLEALRTG